MIYLRRVVGDSMYPTYRNGQTLLVLMSRNFKVGDVVVAFQNKQHVLKRITAMKDGRVFIEGDNKSSSTDSREYGWLQDRLVNGKVIWPKKIKQN